MEAGQENAYDPDNGGKDLVARIHAGAEPGALEVAAVFGSGAFDPDGAERIVQVARQIGEGGSLAARSSATVEDLERSSFVGQYHSVLDVDPSDAEAVPDAVRSVFASLWHPEPRSYPTSFTIDSAGNTTKAWVESVAGLGESLVSGRATPEVVLVPRDACGPASPKEVTAALAIAMETEQRAGCGASHAPAGPRTASGPTIVVMSKTWKIVLAVAVVLVAVVGGGLWWFLRDDAPAKVSLDSAAESVTTTTAGSSATTAAGPVSIDGTWTVDSSTGTFDYESATGTFAGFRIQEELSSIGSTNAVGRTGDVNGTATISGDTLTAATFEVDTRTFKTNAAQRDSRVQSALETGQFPMATFTLTEPVALGSGATAGEDVSVTAVGTFTLHGVTTQVEVPIQARLVDQTIVLVGSFDIAFSDYGVSVPKAPIVLSVADTGTVEMQLLLTKQ